VSGSLGVDSCIRGRAIVRHYPYRAAAKPAATLDPAAIV
jgi:hypothetical protein